MLKTSGAISLIVVISSLSRAACACARERAPPTTARSPPTPPTSSGAPTARACRPPRRACAGSSPPSITTAARWWAATSARGATASPPCSRSRRASPSTSAALMRTPAGDSPCAWTTAREYVSEHFRNQVRFWGVAASYAFIEQPQTNGVAERFFKTLKEQIIYGRVSRTVAELRAAVAAFVDLYNEQ